MPACRPFPPTTTNKNTHQLSYRHIQEVRQREQPQRVARGRSVENDALELSKLGVLQKLYHLRAQGKAQGCRGGAASACVEDDALELSELGVLQKLYHLRAQGVTLAKAVV